jgi:hypothetical protein
MIARFVRSLGPAAGMLAVATSLSAQAPAAPVAATPATAAVPVTAAVATPAPVPVAAPAPAPAAKLATSPGGGPQRWNVVDGLQKQTVASYLEKESLAPEPPVAAKAKSLPRAQTRRTRAVLEDAVFAPLNKRDDIKKYRKW